MPNRWTTQFETWTNLKSQINLPNVFGFKCQTVEPPNLRLEQISSLKLSTASTCLDPAFQTVEPPNSKFEQISNPKAKKKKKKKIKKKKKKKRGRKKYIS